LISHQGRSSPGCGGGARSDEARVAAIGCGFEQGPEFVSQPPGFDIGDHRDGAAALLTGFNIDRLVRRFDSKLQLVVFMVTLS
jgi:hypothetical protein